MQLWRYIVLFRVLLLAYKVSVILFLIAAVPCWQYIVLAVGIRASLRFHVDKAGACLVQKTMQRMRYG